MLLSSTTLSIALFFAGLLLWLSNARISHYVNQLFNRKTAVLLNKTLLRFLIVFPWLVFAAVFLYFFVQKGILFSQQTGHKTIVFGAFWGGLYGLYLFVLTKISKLDTLWPAAIAAGISIPVGFFLFNFYQYQVRFTTSSVQGLGVAAAFFIILVSTLISIGFQQQRTAGQPAKANSAHQTD